MITQKEIVELSDRIGELAREGIEITRGITEENKHDVFKRNLEICDELTAIHKAMTDQ